MFNEWVDKKISSIHCPQDFLIALVKRGDDAFVPNGDTEIKCGDTLVFYEA